MKKLLSLFAILFLLALSIPSHALVAVSSGSVSQANMRLSAVDGTAFVDFSSAGALTPYVGYQIIITDSASKTIVGYIKSAGSAESYGSQKVTNGTWDTDTSGWSATGSATLASVSGGQSGNCLQETLTTTGGAANQTWTATIGGLYKWSIYVKQGTIIGASYTVGIVLPGVTWLSSLNSTNTSSWVQVGKYWAATVANVGFSAETASTLGTALYDEFSCTQVLTPSSTGVTIVSSFGGSTYNWTSQTSGFNYNDSTGYIYAIYPGTVNTTLSGGATTGPILIDCADVAGTLGVDVTGTDTLLNYTIVRCPAGAIQATESCTIKNTIGISAGNDITIATGKTVTALNNLFGDSAKAGAGTYSDAGSTTKWSSDPLFVSASDFHLQPTSPAINAGVNTPWSGNVNVSDYDGKGITDINGNIIAWGGTVDIGAYEYDPRIFFLFQPPKTPILRRTR